MTPESTLVTVDELVDKLAGRSAGARTGRRFVVAIAGPPAAGKTTLTQGIKRALPDQVAILGLDAFHFDNAVLADRSQLDRKGAPFTFDIDGYRRCLRSLIDSRGTDVAIPVFDRELELTRNAAQIVPGGCDVIVTEGNYLLLDAEGWSQLADLFDMTVFVDVSPDVIRQRILERWRHHGFSLEEAKRRADENDMPNAETVLRSSRRAQYIVETAI